ncbi:hypothetical protein ABZV67_38135 [Streptomyces sp. NPDC005065]|uniref:nuclear transport factor 2 family protein n=1 Tax=Streptomyces sp. NPDC005065 TaxID=3154461 RepID=UPI0033B37285
MAHEQAREAYVRETVGRFFRLLREGDSSASPTSSPRRSTGSYPGDEKVLAWGGRRMRREQVPEYFKTLGSAFDPAKGATSMDKFLVDGADALALCTFSLVVKANGRHFNMPVAFQFTVESGHLVRLHLYEDTELVARNVTGSGWDREVAWWPH